ncbi:uncharacterized protein LOC132718935 isoform X1 [Ruditapes philippinarum]|uniref:uncharacterized protein LOC132718935 isoform X1 n=1 Tax=Ruditapes philippinarum TaxID=129788 RepID=UPI00295AFFA4|nr:uncharacterized protein LOC132718935 isoform X1 [Ruditapes philippinarum]
MRIIVVMSVLFGSSFASKECATGRNCEQTCMTNCVTCSRDNVCEQCEPGYFLSYNSCQKCPSNCVTCSSLHKCGICADGFYIGRLYDDSRHQLQTNCSIRCKEECSSCTSYENCNTCTDGRHLCKCKTQNGYNKQCASCYSGKYGSYCQWRCSVGCKNHTCDFNAGTCECALNFQGYRCNRCIEGKYGSKCDTTCPLTCKGNICERNGSCTECKEGFTGENCQKKCERCKPGTACGRYNGICDECIEGYYSTNCERQCSKNCKTCARNNPHHCMSCKSGRYRKIIDRNGQEYTSCHQDCPDHCLNKTCTFESSECDRGCVKGHWGVKCNNTCSDDCTDDECFQNNGTCSFRKTCDANRFGKKCEYVCHRNCLANENGRSCNSLNGQCIGDCLPGYLGDFCDLNCSGNCQNTSCNKDSGFCLFGCIDGYKGDKCDLQESIQNGIWSTNIVIIIATTAAAISAIIIIAILLLRRRCKIQRDKREMKKNADEEIASVCNQQPTNHPDNEIVYAMPNKQKETPEADTPPKGKPTNDNLDLICVENTSNYINHDSAARNMCTKNDIGSREMTVVKQETTEDCFTDEESVTMETGRYKTGHMVYQSGIETATCTDDTYYNVLAVNQRKITIDKFPEFVAKKTTQDFVNEFQQLPNGLIKPYDDSQKKENMPKNRYQGLFPYDDTRVVLREGDTNYINASYIDGYNKRKAYIASTGPTIKFMGDMSAFWIMVWQEKVGKIVMLTKLIEAGASKCDQYWPERGFSLNFTNIQVTCQSEDIFSNYTKRSFVVKQNKEERVVLHFHFTAWPDQRTPNDVTSLVEFRQRVIRSITNLNGPIVVHCSAGIGRTGTYIAVDSLTEEGETEGGVDVYAFVRNMRQQRVNMVQTVGQYQYLHHALVHTLTFDSKAVQASKFTEYMKTHKEDYLGKMFGKLQASLECRSDDEIKAVERNKALLHKNRDGSDIPGDINRPKLYMSKTTNSQDYINAVYVDSYRSENHFLMAQTPLPDTVVDFLTLIVQENVSCVISMETDLLHDKTVGVFYPADKQTLKIGAFKIQTGNGRETDQYIFKNLTISRQGKSRSEKITITNVQFKHWNDNQAVPEQPKAFVQFVKDVELKFGGNGPTLIHCRTGAEKSGLFCAVSTLLEKTQIDQEVSVANTVRHIKYRRSMAIPNQEQYIFCHQCVNEYLQSFDTYSNFEQSSGT